MGQKKLIDLERHLSATFVDQVKEVCKPLFINFGIKYFDYGRFYKDGSSIILYSDGNWVDTFLNVYAYKIPTTILKPGNHLWQTYIDEEILRTARNEFGYDHGITLSFDNHPNYTEVVNFSAPSENRVILNVYLNKLEALRQFFTYFLVKFDKVIAQLEKNRILLPESMRGCNIINYDEKIIRFIQSISNESEPSINKLHLLTEREHDCLNLLAQGHSAKKIALVLNISNRTVEKHLDNIRQKLGCKSRLEILARFNRV